MTTDGIGRRHAIAGVAGLGVAAPLLASCGDDGASTGTDDSGSGAAAGTVLGATSEVPVGGGTIFDDEKVVVTQPTEGDFKAFTAVCTHQGCVVDKVEEGQIMCPCHGSVFSAEDGSVVNGPATEPLAETAITVEGDEITLA
ncbi:Rieske (2Fe-2S) protein [Nocardioides euryhalodurans]|uniref:Cytochrome bc1 complex Rieske iron-sulfur subunit n=1 Tax=Nocardioides euryhalodurans TaxID=2518370 RepID=A0A4P7GHA2_9ACTN|nr:Rieske (2Fe-2S) protein [Nocardioides euryhalodurans]QBR91037.1 Rieske (2Fe-2S) protein [Nocardioides euryhalodurans]